MRRAYRDRALYLGDPEFNSDIPKDRLISKAYALDHHLHECPGDG
jgi:gamma-glutamyltranspeptidase/glutathione hydrolase